MFDMVLNTPLQWNQAINSNENGMEMRWGNFVLLFNFNLLTNIRTRDRNEAMELNEHHWCLITR